MRVLDRSFFKKRIAFAAANIFDIRNQPRVRRECVQDVLDAPRIKPFVTTPWGHNKERTLLLLKPGVKVDGMYICHARPWRHNSRLMSICADPSTHSKKLKWFLKGGWMKLVTYNLDLDYDYWTYGALSTPHSRTLVLILPSPPSRRDPRCYPPRKPRISPPQLPAYRACGQPAPQARVPPPPSHHRPSLPGQNSTAQIYCSKAAPRARG